MHHNTVKETSRQKVVILQNFMTFTSARISCNSLQKLVLEYRKEEIIIKCLNNQITNQYIICEPIGSNKCIVEETKEIIVKKCLKKIN